MNKENTLFLASGLGLGAGLMYLLDPAGGRRRRAFARDKATHFLTVGKKAATKTSKDLGNRTKGLASSAGKVVSRKRKEDKVRTEDKQAGLAGAPSDPAHNLGPVLP